MKYGILIRTTEYQKMEIESDQPLTDQEREEIESMGEDGIPERFSIVPGEAGGEYPSSVEIHDLG